MIIKSTWYLGAALCKPCIMHIRTPSKDTGQFCSTVVLRNPSSEYNLPGSPVCLTSAGSSVPVVHPEMPHLGNLDTADDTSMGRAGSWLCFDTRYSLLILRSSAPFFSTSRTLFSLDISGPFVRPYILNTGRTIVRHRAGPQPLSPFV
jgi:hypothetical protein